MRCVSFLAGDEQRIGVVRGDRIREIELEAGPHETPGAVAEAAVSDWHETGDVFERGEVDIQPPVSRPGKIIGVGLNYHDHAAEAGQPPPEEPRIWAKAPTAILPPGDSIVYPYETEQLDYECELAVVVSREGRRIPRENALDHVAGFTAFNDVSARDIQASTTGEMIFPVERLVEYVSSSMTLRPGDIIATGTPPGVGLHRDPPGLLEPGDVVRVELEGVGTLENDVVSEGAIRERRPADSS